MFLVQDPPLSLACISRLPHSSLLSPLICSTPWRPSLYQDQHLPVYTPLPRHPSNSIPCSLALLRFLSRRWCYCWLPSTPLGLISGRCVFTVPTCRLAFASQPSAFASHATRLSPVFFRSTWRYTMRPHANPIVAFFSGPLGYILLLTTFSDQLVFWPVAIPPSPNSSPTAGRHNLLVTSLNYSASCRYFCLNS